ncbi:MAG: tetratricopeptide repeat protein [candidate division Zixibacteria bacterium]|nr:tetratricopeptide repeat protein [candidate division Zixibacteria bacterium]
MTTIRLPERYEVLNKIGAGGGGEVFAVHDRERDLDLALKVFIPDDFTSFDEQAFFEEFLLSLKLNCRYLTCAYDYGYTRENLPYYTMELLPRSNIYEQVSAYDDKHLIDITRMCSEAIAFLHHFNLLHNDLKPANVKLAESSNRLLVKLLDFGLALDNSLENARHKLSGTVEFMAPELFDNQSADSRSDMYSLGVMLYLLVCGRLPFEDDDPLKVISSKLEQEAPEIVQDDHDLPEEFLDLISALLSRKPEERPGNAWQLAYACAELSGGQEPAFDFNELLSTAVSLRLAKEFYKQDFHENCNASYCFSDKVVLESFRTILTAEYQKRNIEVISRKDIKSKTSARITARKSAGQVSIDTTLLTDGGTTVQPDNQIRLYLQPSVRLVASPPGAREIALDIVAEIENWFDPEVVNGEFLEKLSDISSDSIETLAEILNEMQAADIIGYDGEHWAVDVTDFIAYCPSNKILIKILEAVNYLGPDERMALRRLAVINHEFDEQFYVKFELDHSYEPDRMLRRFEESGLLTKKNNRYRLKNQLLRVAMLSENDPDTLKKLHMKAAEIVKKSAVFTREQKALYIARHYTLAESLQESLRWTLKAVEHRLSSNQYRFALKLVSNCLQIAFKQSEHEDTTNHIARLLNVKGDIENKLGLTNTALASFARIVRLKNKIERREYLAAAYKHLGDIYKSRFDYRRGLKALEKALGLYREIGDKVEISHTYNNLGNMHWVGSKIDLALESYFKALKIQEELDLKKDIASTLSNIGSCYVMQHEYAKTIDYYKRSIAIKEEINDLPELARTYNNLGVTYYELGQIKPALKYLYDALKINRDIDSTREIMFNLDNIASCELTLGNYQKAESMAQEGLSTSTELEDQPFQLMFMITLSTVWLQSGEFVQVEKILDEAEMILANIEDPRSAVLLYLNYSRLFLSLYQPDIFSKYLEKTLELSYKNDDPLGIVNSLALKSEAELEFADDFEAAQKAIDEGLQVVAKHEFNNLKGVISLARMKTDLACLPGCELDYLDEVAEIMSDPVNSILRAEYLYLRGMIAMRRGELDSAATDFETALRRSDELCQICLKWKIKFQLGNLKQKQLDYEEAYISYKEAVAVLKVLARKIDNKKYLQSFLKQPRAENLKSEISTLVNKMNHKDESRL